ncbi:MAG: DUF1501 domain-containing protein [Gemmataceae bacterium]|nr:DUF1501 domain-containing protein [Gemmataceae bacterium]
MPVKRRFSTGCYLFGGPSHLDMYDMKPNAPAEYRGEFRPTQTNVPGMEICDLMPKQSRIADKFTIVRNMDFTQPRLGAHSPVYIYGGNLSDPKTATHPVFGSVLSKLWSERRAGELRPRGGLPPYVALDNYDVYTAWLGNAYRPFVPAPLRSLPLLNDNHPDIVNVADLRNFGLARGLSLERVQDRATLLRTFDSMRRDADNAQGSLAAVDAYQARALAMITDPAVRDAFDVSLESPQLRDSYGKVPHLLLARRLAEAGVPLIQVTIDGAGHQLRSLGNGFDTHGNNFQQMRGALPEYDQAIATFLSDLYDRGLNDSVAVVIWGEFGRTPRVNGSAGRDHWPQAGFTVMSGGGWRMGQVIGATNARGERPVGNAYTPDNVLACVYRHFGIDAGRTTITDPTGRPHYLLRDPRPIQELL